MISKIFFSVLLLTCVYTYKLKSIKDNENINFQKIPDNFNFELNGIETAKPILKSNIIMVKGLIRKMFGTAFINKFDK